MSRVDSDCRNRLNCNFGNKRPLHNLRHSDQYRRSGQHRRSGERRNPEGRCNENTQAFQPDSQRSDELCKGRRIGHVGRARRQSARHLWATDAGAVVAFAGGVDCHSPLLLLGTNRSAAAAVGLAGANRYGSVEAGGSARSASGGDWELHIYAVSRDCVVVFAAVEG